MKHSMLILTIATFINSINESKAQVTADKTYYVMASAGLSRSEDGLKFLKKTSTSQWTPMMTIGFGYQFHKFVSVETYAATMLQQLKAEGTLVSNAAAASVMARHSSLIISPNFHLPIHDRSEIFLRTGVGQLFSRSRITDALSDPPLEKSTSNIGFMISLGYARRLNDHVSLTIQFDFSDAYGNEDVWTGDLGLLNIGIRYSLMKAN